jgi:hypothetical protein
MTQLAQKMMPEDRECIATVSITFFNETNNQRIYIPLLSMTCLHQEVCVARKRGLKGKQGVIWNSLNACVTIKRVVFNSHKHKPISQLLRDYGIKHHASLIHGFVDPENQG